MFNSFFPRQADNDYRGYHVALWLFGVALLMKTLMSLNSIFNGHTVASGADGIPLDTYGPGGAQAVVAMFAAWGLAQLLICLLGALALVRYRTLIPLLFALLIADHLGRRLVMFLLPIAKHGTPPGAAINHVLLALLAVGLGLSLWCPAGRLSGGDTVGV